MADAVIKKRPAVLRLAELEKYPTLEDRYAATLPFKGGAADCDCLWYSKSMNCCDMIPPGVREKCIKRTGERWAWFSSARDLDDTCGERLGTLIHLPWEIRQIIIEKLFDGALGCLGVVYADDIIRGGVRSPSYGCGSRHEPYDGLWLASPSTKFEMDHYYFSNIGFDFYDPDDLQTFADHLSTYEWSLLRSVTIHLEHDDRFRDWVFACARLPPNLVSIQLVSDWNNVRGTKIDGQWFIIPTGFRVPSDEELDRAVIRVNTLGRLAHRLAAKAKIGLVVWGEDVASWDGLGYTHPPRHRVLDDLEPWSKEYLSWWEKETKIDLERDGTSSKVA